MLKNKTFVTFFTNFEYQHFNKDVGMIPVAMKKYAGINAKILYYSKKDVQIDESHDVELVNLYNYSFLGFLNIYLFLICNSYKISYLNLYHLYYKSYILLLIYKFCNWKGNVYLKLDMNSFNAELINKRSKLKLIHTKFILKYFVKVISVETLFCHKILQSKFKNIKEKIHYLPNGSSFEFKLKEEYNKENVVLYVGRIGSYEKNVEMFLSSLVNIDLKDWKVYLIGPVSEEFKKTIKKSEIENNKNIFFLGNIDDRNILASYYQKSKVLCLTSRWESFGIVLSEALFYNNYIISTPVGAAIDIINEKNGIIINDSFEMKTILEQIISGERNIEVNNINILNIFSYKNIVNKIVNK